MILWAWEGDALYAPLVEFITTRIWGSPQDMAGGTVMAVVQGDAVIGACLFHNWQPDEGVIELTSASVSPKWLNRESLWEMFHYAFDRMRCQAAVMRVDPMNARMCRIATAFGFKRYDIPRLRGRDKAEAIFVLGDEEWRGGRFYKEKRDGKKSPQAHGPEAYERCDDGDQYLDRNRECVPDEHERDGAGRDENLRPDWLDFGNRPVHR